MARRPKNPTGPNNVVAVQMTWKNGRSPIKVFNAPRSTKARASNSSSAGLGWAGLGWAERHAPLLTQRIEKLSALRGLLFDLLPSLRPEHLEISIPCRTS